MARALASATSDAAATAQFQWLYRGYLLDCMPVQDRNGRYSPHLSVRTVGRTKHPGVSVLLPDCEPTRRPEEAAQFALVEGRAWVDAVL